MSQVGAPDDSMANPDGSDVPLLDNSRSPDPNLNTPSSVPLVWIIIGFIAFEFAVISAGAVMGSIFGLGSGLLERKGFKGSFESAASYAKSFCFVASEFAVISAGAVMGSILGLGLLERKGFSARYAKALAASVVVNHLVRRFMKLLRGKDGSINRSLAAGCSAGVMNYILGPDP